MTIPVMQSPERGVDWVRFLVRRQRQDQRQSGISLWRAG
jgi:hypothetical protein